MIQKERWIESLKVLYGESEAVKIADRMEERFKKYENGNHTAKWLDETDSILITYGDTLYKDGENGFTTLHKFLNEHVKDAISTVHILPMFPYTSDDGFSVVDYKKINPELGCWEDVEKLAEDYGLMFDAVINHISKSSDWFQKYLNCEAPYSNYFITCDPDGDYSSVTRPRALPLLTEFDTKEGKKYVWTTFSEDQVDLNFQCPDVLIDILDVLITYAQKGARFIRLDAIGFLWKKQGTTCMHLDETHEAVRLMRKILEDYAQGTLIITETNVPHKDNISYFGDGTNEAQLIYQFPLPPLTMFSLLTGDATKLTQWAEALDTPAKGTTYFNFLSSHDGVGVRPTEGILNKDEQQILVDSTIRNGGVVSYKNNGDGTKSPYELNINYQDALASPEDSDSIRIARFMAAETILLSMQGLPGIYIHSLLGSRNDYYGKTTSGIPRRINREKLDVEILNRRLTEPGNRKIIFEELIRRLNIRKQHSAFAPDASQKILHLDNRIYALVRKDDKEEITVIINVSDESVQLEDIELTGYDILNNCSVSKNIEIKPYETKWIIKKEDVK